MATFCYTASLTSVRFHICYWLLVAQQCILSGCVCLCLSVYLLGWGGEGCRMRGCKTPVIAPHILSLTDLWSEQSCVSLELDVLNQAAGPRGKCCLSVWNFIIFIYLDHDGSCSPSLPFLLFSLSRTRRPFLTDLSVCSMSAAPLPSLPCAASPLLITPINIFNFCHFPVLLSSPLRLFNPPPPLERVIILTGHMIPAILILASPETKPTKMILALLSFTGRWKLRTKGRGISKTTLSNVK